MDIASSCARTFTACAMHYTANNGIFSSDELHSRVEDYYVANCIARLLVCSEVVWTTVNNCSPRCPVSTAVEEVDP